MLLSRKVSELQARKARGEKGFSLIEMLVVVIIIGVIAAIAVPLFLNQQEKAEDANAKATLVTLAKNLANGQGTGGSAEIDGNILTVTDGAGGITTAPLNGATVTGSSVLSSGTWCVTLDGFTIAAGEAQPRESESCTPGGVSNLSATPGVAEVSLSWSTPQDTGSQTVTGYKVEYATGSGGPWTVAVANTASTSRTVTGLTGGTQYWFKVTALNAFGEGTAATTTSVPLVPPPIFAVEYLVIAGGGSGGSDGGGGGGAGGYRSNVSGESSGGGSSAEPALSLSVGEAYTVTVGAGGVTNGGYKGAANKGANSVFGSIVSIGGGAGGGFGPAATTGGSGGGGGYNTYGQPGTANQGRSGGGVTGNRMGGGGGASTSGGGYVGGFTAGVGGNGIASSITGTSVARGGGGGGTGNVGGLGGGGNGKGGSQGNGTNGAPNTGGGGGGGAFSNLPVGNGSAGGSGVVILKYPAAYTVTFSGGVTHSTSTIGGFKVTQITATATTSETVTFS